MRVLRAFILILITVGLVYVLNRPFGMLPPLGKFLDPINGCWVSAEPVKKDFNAKLDFPALQHPVTIWFDGRLVPHVHAATPHDVYFVQGYLHAYFRLWQMDMETRAAAGRISEIVGPKALNYDRKQRRKGMVYAAENSLKAMDADPRTKEMLDAYTAGINSYISSIGYRHYPLEYKLMGFAPEKWTSLKCALLLKYMADDLTGYTEDIPLTFLRDRLPKEDFDLLYPETIAGSTPVIPKGTLFQPPSLAMPAVPADSNIWTHFTPADFQTQREEPEAKGSNNWVVGGTRTKSGVPILCNDPHLGLHLPSLWYEMQMQTPNMNVYGVSLPGAPGIIIGFNDSISWGFTNNYRDVKDFYAVKQVSDNSYWYDGKEVPFKQRIERIAVKGADTFLDKVNYTVQGPVMYDKDFPGPGGLKIPLAMEWMAHRPTNELLAVYLMNRARNYMEFTNAIWNFQCPAQNMAYADKEGNISIWGQGQFIDKWKDQGRYVMNGDTSSTMWGKDIPASENPHALNPAQGYLCSANQSVTDSTYPYYYNGYFKEFRAWRINHVLDTMHSATVNQMFSLQNDTYSILAGNMVPIMLQYMQGKQVDTKKQQYLDSLKHWNDCLSANSVSASVFQVWWHYLYTDIWKDDFENVPDQLWPLQERTMQLIQTDTALKYYDDKNTPQVEHLGDIVKRSFNEAMDSLGKLEKNGLQWYKVKNTTVKHLANLMPFSYPDLQIGGWGNVVNAAKSDHGPSWRMVVKMSKNIEAYGVYPGGQSGNPGSKYYATFLQHWVHGKYYHLLFLPDVDKQSDQKIKYTWMLKP